MTEILFSFLLVFSAYLFFSNRPVLSALALSFLPFVRTEGVIILPIFAFAFLLYKNYRALPFLFCAYIAYSIVGYFVYGDINWVINQVPYGDSSSIYGSGSLWHFVARTKSINGLPLGLLFTIGLLYLTYGTIRNKISTKSLEFKILLIVAAPAIAYYAAHSYVWWQGKGASLGLIRVMAGITPLMAIISLKGLNDLISTLSLKPQLNKLALYMLLVIVTITPFRIYQIPVPIYEREKLVKDASEWLKSSELLQNKILYFDPLVSYYSGLDPFDNNRCGMAHGFNYVGTVKLNENELLVWDAGFGPVEGRLPKERLLKSNPLQLIKRFAPEISFKVFGENDFEILVFAPRKHELPQQINDKLELKYKNLGTYRVLKYGAFISENDSIIEQDELLKNSYLMDPSREFELSYSIPFIKFYKGDNFKHSVFVSAKVYIPKGITNENLSLCM